MGIDPDISRFLDACREGDGRRQPSRRTPPPERPRRPRRPPCFRRQGRRPGGLASRSSETPTPPPVTSERFGRSTSPKANAGHLFTGNLTSARVGSDHLRRQGSSTRRRRRPGRTRCGSSAPARPPAPSHLGEGAGRHRRGLRRPQHPRPEGYAGHNTHGLTVGCVDGAQLRDLRVVGVKGSGSSPPAETFALEVWQALNVTVDDCTIDGQNVGHPVRRSTEQRRREDRRLLERLIASHRAAQSAPGPCGWGRLCASGISSDRRSGPGTFWDICS